MPKFCTTALLEWESDTENEDDISFVEYHQNGMRVDVNSEALANLRRAEALAEARLTRRTMRPPGEGMTLAAFLIRREEEMIHVLVSCGDEPLHEETHPIPQEVMHIMQHIWAEEYYTWQRLREARAKMSEQLTRDQK